MAERLLEALRAAGTGYDDDVLEGLVGTIAADPSSAQGIVDNLLGGNPKAAAAVRAFVGGGGGGGGGGAQRQQQQRSASSSSPAPSRAASSAARAPYVPPPLPSFTSSRAQQAAPQPPRPPSPAPPPPATTAATAVVDGRRVALEQAEAQLAIFKKGGRIRASRPADGSSNGNNGDGGGAGGHASLFERFERRVANCLSCGKVFDGREATQEIVAFVNRGGTCDFCGAQVALTYAEARAQAMAQEGGGGVAVGGDEEDAATQAATAAARDLKDRLVTYDRESARRTTVLDDQSDFYEVSQLEGDAWASEDDRAAARARAEVERAAAAEAEARRRKFSVTLDLLGRRVLRAEPGAGGDEVGIEVGGGGGSSAAAAAAARIPELGAAGTRPAAAAAASKAPQHKQQQQAAGERKAAAAEPAVTAEALEAAYASVANLRIRPVDDVAASGEAGEGGKPRVRYVPSAAAAGGRAGGRGGGRGGRGGGRDGGAAAAARQPLQQRSIIQDDSAFAELEGVLLYDQVAAGS